MAALALKPRVNADADVDVIVVIAEVVMAVTWIGEQAELQPADVDDDAG
jgi:hypothetical protein